MQYDTRARLLAVEVLLADPEALGNDALETVSTCCATSSLVQPASRSGRKAAEATHFADRSCHGRAEVWRRGGPGGPWRAAGATR